MIEIVAIIIALAAIFAIFWLYDTLNDFCTRKFKMPLKDLILVIILVVILGSVAVAIVRFYVTGQPLDGG